MKLKKKLVLLICVMLLLCIFAYCQQTLADSSEPNKPFITDLKKVPEVIAFGFAWPSAEEMSRRKFSPSSETEQQVRTVILKCLKPNFYDLNEHKTFPKLTWLKDWPIPKQVTRIKQFKSKDYILSIYDNDTNIFIAIKRADGNDVWDMNKDHSKFVPQTIEKFFINENVGPHKGEKMYYTPCKGKAEGFYYVYFPADEEDFWGAYMWTNGKIIALRVCKLFEEDKKKAAKEE